MSTVSFEAYGGSAPENYERYFVPAIGEPLARDLVEAARLRPGERVLDVACGTGIVARLAATEVGGSGSVTGVDVNPGMLAVATSATPPGVEIDWHEASAESIPLPDGSFDAVVCQMGLQFVPGKLDALREMARVLTAGGRLALNLPGPTPPPFAAFADSLARHIDPELAKFVHVVFSMHDGDELRELLEGAGFADILVQRDTTTLRLPPPDEFLWQYVHSTPLAPVVGQASDEQRDAVARDVLGSWESSTEDGALLVDVGMLVATARRP